MNSVFSIFERVYVINLKERTDRRIEIEEQFQKVGMTLALPKVKVFEAARPTEAAGFENAGAHGCFMSHLGILKEARAQRYKSILVLEDDVNFAQDFVARMEVIESILSKQDWSIFYGGYQRAPEAEHSATEDVFKIDPGEELLTSHFVAFNGRCMGELVDHLEAMRHRPAGSSEGGPMHVDGAYNWFRRQHPEHATLLASVQLGYQRSSRTNVHALRWFDKLPLVSYSVDVLRKTKNAFHKYANRH